MWSSITLRCKKLLYFSEVFDHCLFKPQFGEDTFSVAILIIHYVPKQHSPTCTCSKCDPKPSEIFLFNGFGLGPESTRISWMKLHSLLGVRFVLSLGFVVIRFILPNIRLISCFEGLCTCASHYPWTVFDARTEEGRHFSTASCEILNI